MSADIKAGFVPNCQTTAMSILPHRNIDKALGLVLSLDIPFWPQLPRNSFYEDMYAQAAYDFPGVTIDIENEKITFSTNKFMEELNDYSHRLLETDAFTFRDDYATVYREFLKQDLGGYAAIHGQIPGPVNLGFRINDEASKPIIYNEDARGLLFDFIQRKFNAQLKQLRRKNERAFVWLDAPGLLWVFSGLSGYTDIQAKNDYPPFLEGLDGLKALHLCTNINLPYLLGLGIEFLSFDAHQLELMPKAYAPAIADFIRRGGIMCWGIVPTEPAALDREIPESLGGLLTGYWEVVAQQAGLDINIIARQSLLAPAKCCVKSQEFAAERDKPAAADNPGTSAEEASVEKAYDYLKTLSRTLRDKYGLDT